MGNCGACACDTQPDEKRFMTKFDRINEFESMLPFHSLSVDQFESLFMGACKVNKVDDEYVPPLTQTDLYLRRVVKYFKKVKGFQSLADSESPLNTILKSKLISHQTFATSQVSKQPYDSQ